MTAAITGLGANGAAYLANIYRAGIDAVDRGQREAALSLGLTPTAVLIEVVLPQAVRIMIPAQLPRAADSESLGMNYAPGMA